MITVGRASARLLQALVLRDEQSQLEPLMLADAEYVHALERSTWCWAMQSGSEVLAAGGVVEIWPGRGFAWALVGRAVLGDMAAGRRLVRESRRALEAVPFRRIEAAVRADWVKARKFAEAVGFELECESMRAFDPLGRTCALYAHVRGYA